ncbi:MAG: bifunctional 4-hydroxy-2-oxoglutarate aldolase/2-dehydro-3-deoxy-phosphogluconate aldolase [Bacteroidota bacterium]
MQPIHQKAMTPDIINSLATTGVIAVLVIENVRHAVPVAEALLKGGVPAIELTLRTPAALESAYQIKRTFPEMILGFGTVLTTEQVKAVADVGADFAVAPGCNPRIIEEAIRQGLSFAPGVMTPSEIEIAVEAGCRLLKFFPAESSGGMKHLKSMAAPYRHLGLNFIPLGGLNLQNAHTYLASPLVTTIGGSWLAKAELIRAEDWAGITRNARQVRTLINEVRTKNC